MSWMPIADVFSTLSDKNSLLLIHYYVITLYKITNLGKQDSIEMPNSQLKSIITMNSGKMGHSL